MMTTLSDMFDSFRPARIIAVALLALVLGACSMLRIGYNQAPDLLYWWLDGYADFNGEQTPRVRAAIDDWFGWHRSDQLPALADLLARAQAEVLAPTDAAAVCGWRDEIQRRLETAYEQSIPALAGLALSLRPEQLRHIERRQRKANDEYRNDYLQSDTAERQQALLKRTVDRAETLYGRLDARQRNQLSRALATSPFDAALWLAERQARQQELLQTLRTLSAPGRTPDVQAARSALRTLAQHAAQSPRPAYRSYQQRLTEFNCSLVADLHNSTTPAQRQAARKRLEGWQADLRALSNGA
jgi:hypothetical protein